MSFLIKNQILIPKMINFIDKKLNDISIGIELEQKKTYRVAQKKVDKRKNFLFFFENFFQDRVIE
jgi:hypothetical protein